MDPCPVHGKKTPNIAERMRRLGLREEDLEESFVCSGGAGGQNVNKVSTCVVLKHKPSGLIVKCQEERGQALNRFLARELLVGKLEERIRQRERERVGRIEKLRRQKRKRSKRSKEKMLDSKRKRGELKRLRSRPSGDH